VIKFYLVQHDIIMYWTEVFQGDVDINLVLKGSNSQTERIRLQQNTRRPGFGNTARAKYVLWKYYEYRNASESEC
jgi:hypothetical protein